MKLSESLLLKTPNLLKKTSPWKALECLLNNAQFILVASQDSFIFFNIYLFIYLAASGLHWGTWDLHCGTWDLCCGPHCSTWTLHCGTQASLQLWHVGFLFLVVMCRFSLLQLWHRFQSTWALQFVAHGLSSSGAWAQLPSSMWDLSSPTMD